MRALVAECLVSDIDWVLIGESHRKVAVLITSYS